LRVAQLLPELNEGGVERGVVELNRELVARGIESIVVSAGGKLAELIVSDGGQHHELDVASKNPLTAPMRIRQLRSLLQRLAPDILHARSRVPAWLTWLANRSLKLPLVTTVHGFNSVNAYSRIMTRGDRVICVSGAIRDFVIQNYGVDPSRLRVIPRGVDLQKFSPENLNHAWQEEFTTRYGLSGRIVIATVGRITQLKDLETFIRAIGILRERQPEVLGLIVGGVRADKLDYFKSLNELVADLDLREHVRFTGSQSEVAEIYALSKVVVSSSKKPESFGRSAAEALAVGVPVVATGHGGILDIVIEAETGYLFQPGDAEGLAGNISAALHRPWPGLREFVSERFTLQQMVEQTLAVYRDIGSDPAG